MAGGFGEGVGGKANGGWSEGSCVDGVVLSCRLNWFVVGLSCGEDVWFGEGSVVSVFVELLFVGLGGCLWELELGVRSVVAGAAVGLVGSLVYCVELRFEGVGSVDDSLGHLIGWDRLGVVEGGALLVVECIDWGLLGEVVGLWRSGHHWDGCLLGLDLLDLNLLDLDLLLYVLGLFVEEGDVSVVEFA